MQKYSKKQNLMPYKKKKQCTMTKWDLFQEKGRERETRERNLKLYQIKKSQGNEKKKEHQVVRFPLYCINGWGKLRSKWSFV